MGTALGAAASNIDAFTSSPRSVVFNLAAATAKYQGSFLGAVVPPGTANGARLSLSVRFDLLDPDQGQQDFFILRTDGVGGVTIHRTIDAGGTDAWAFGPSFQAIDTPAMNKWIPVVFDVTFDAADAGTGTATLTFDGKAYAAIPSGMKAPTSTVGILLGGQSTTTTAPKVHYSIDDVLLELK